MRPPAIQLFGHYTRHYFLFLFLWRWTPWGVEVEAQLEVKPGHGGCGAAGCGAWAWRLRPNWRWSQCILVLAVEVPCPNTCTKKFPLMSMVGLAKCQACTVPGAKTTIGVNRNSNHKPQPKAWHWGQKLCQKLCQNLYSVTNNLPTFMSAQLFSLESFA